MDKMSRKELEQWAKVRGLIVETHQHSVNKLQVCPAAEPGNPIARLRNRRELTAWLDGYERGHREGFDKAVRRTD